MSAAAETLTPMGPAEIRQRLDYLAKRERAIRTTPATDPDAILSEEQKLADIRQERVTLAQQLKDQEAKREADRQAQADAKATARDEALEEAERLRAQLVKKAAAFEQFLEMYQEYHRLSHVAFIADRHLETHGDPRAMKLHGLNRDVSRERTRVVLMNAFADDNLFNVPPFVQNRNAGYSVRDALEAKPIRLF